MNLRRYFHVKCTSGSRETFGHANQSGPSRQRLQMVRKKGLILSVAMLALLGFSACERSATGEIGNTKEMIAALSAKVPVGTSVAVAKVFMESEKFEVTVMTKEKWKGKSGITFLQCLRRDGSPPIFRKWEVALINDGKVITSIEARTALLYP